MPYLLLSSPEGQFSTATLTGWLISTGQRFAEGQELAECETESGRMIVEAPAVGCLAELLIQPGQTVAIGARLARFDAADASPQIGPSPEVKEQAMAEGHSTRGGKVIPVLM